MAFFKKKEKSSGLVKHLLNGLKSYGKCDENKNKQEKITNEVSGYIHSMKDVFYPDGRLEAAGEASEQLANEILSSDLIPPLFSNLHAFTPEARKEWVVIFSHLMRRKQGARLLYVEYLERETSLLDILCLGYEVDAIASTCGQLLRICIDTENLAKHILYSPHFYKLFNSVEHVEFDVASDAFATFKDLLTKHKALSAEFLEKNYDQVFQNYTKLLHSGNYVTRRQSLKLLGELLLDRANFNVMTKYISDQENLKLMMNLLRDKSRNIQFEAFHVFKVFVANPNKAKPILDILVNNKDKLVIFLESFHADRAGEDEQFADEKAFLLKQIEQLPSST